MKTTDLLNGWTAIQYNDGSMVIRNSDFSQRIVLDPASVERLREICRADVIEVEPSPAERAFYRGFARPHA